MPRGRQPRARRQAREGLGFVHSRLPIPTWWRPLPFDSPTLVGWAGGPRATRLSGLSPSSLLDRALGWVAEIFGGTRSGWEAELDGHRIADWRSDPFARGGYAVMPIGGPTELSREINSRDSIPGVVFRLFGVWDRNPLA